MNESNSKSTTSNAGRTEPVEEKLITCGVIMPISEIEGCPATHWSEVKSIIEDSISAAGFTPNLVSTTEEVGTILKTILQNLYKNPIVVCDVSAKNPNVMFELGIRLAFDKPAIIIKDDFTAYSFDTAAIEHLEYPRDLRFSKVVEFKKRLSEKIRATYNASVSDNSFTTFLKNFGEFTVAKLDEREVPSQEFVINQLLEIKTSLSRLEKANSDLPAKQTVFSVSSGGISSVLGSSNSALIAGPVTLGMGYVNDRPGYRITTGVPSSSQTVLQSIRPNPGDQNQ